MFSQHEAMILGISIFSKKIISPRCLLPNFGPIWRVFREVLHPSFIERHKLGPVDIWDAFWNAFPFMYLQFLEILCWRRSNLQGQHVSYKFIPMFSNGKANDKLTSSPAGTTSQTFWPGLDRIPMPSYSSLMPPQRVLLQVCLDYVRRTGNVYYNRLECVVAIVNWYLVFSHQVQDTVPKTTGRKPWTWEKGEVFSSTTIRSPFHHRLGTLKAAGQMCQEEDKIAFLHNGIAVTAWDLWQVEIVGVSLNPGLG